MNKFFISDIKWKTKLNVYADTMSKLIWSWKWTVNGIDFFFEKLTFWLFVCFVPSLSSCHEKVAVALYFERILTRLEFTDFQVFRLIYWTSSLLICCLFESTSRNIHRKVAKVHYPRTQQSEEGGNWTETLRLWSQ